MLGTDIPIMPCSELDEIDAGTTRHILPRQHLIIGDARVGLLERSGKQLGLGPSAVSQARTATADASLLGRAADHLCNWTSTWMQTALHSRSKGSEP